MIIRSLLDTDLYKFTMMQVVLHQFPAAEVEYRFRCRTSGIDLAPCLDAIRAEIDALCELRFSEAELDWLRSLRFMEPDFVDFLGLFRLNAKYVQLGTAPDQNGGIELIVRGPWLHTILFEIPLLAIISECWFRHLQPQPDLSTARARLRDKMAMLKQFGDDACRIADYGTRRRYSADWHDELIVMLADTLGPRLAGTSNVRHAMIHGLTPLGSMGHEYLQACQALGPRLRDAQSFAFDRWAHEYRGDLGIALSDTYGLDAFLRDFDLYFCKLFDGARHDSGDPFVWGERVLEHYQQMRVDPTSKSLVFSDSLTIPRILELNRRFRGRTRLAFGIGTNLTNDAGPTPLNIVIKMVRCNGQPVIKLSDDPGKVMADDPSYLAYLRQVFDVPASERT
ncbi:nicotinate phosphoribosyltransferase [Solimonas marina]|uniref:Nicotinate phosphoribosyltransferase n=1 Tax=Solimonas marina TaxID=2714601 RepID=A0A969W918_9GAMM|nr:nicotinate phosphoribosyltransferase [Solimonas marina]NKF22139.1 nicotinate phosphoribosyltransferase [Solimonas marina]